ncbi:Fc.00g071160.m01.CDS01 [Cosmosporella sp. VM-42]
MAESMFPEGMKDCTIVDSFLNLDGNSRDDRIREKLTELIEIYADLSFYGFTEYYKQLGKRHSSAKRLKNKIEFMQFCGVFSDERIAVLDQELQTVERGGSMALRFLRLNSLDRCRLFNAFEAEDCVDSGEVDRRLRELVSEKKYAVYEKLWQDIEEGLTVRAMNKMFGWIASLSGHKIEKKKITIG